MKRILIVSHAMELGGAERSLLGLLESIDYTRYSVDLFLLRHCGELLSLIPPQVRLLEEKKAYAALAVPVSQALRRGRLGVVLGRAAGKMLARRYIARHGIGTENEVELEYSHKYTCALMPPIGEGEYDLAVSFLTPHYFVAQKVRAAVKIAWIHTDYRSIEMDVPSQRKMWWQYERIVSISPSVGEAFCARFPELRERLLEMENILPKELVRRGAQQDVSAEMPDDGSIRLLSVGRYSHAKNFDHVPEICSLLRKMGLAVTWYLIGYGDAEPLIRRRIAQWGMEDHVILLGKRENPYPYMVRCHLYVQPSRYEGKSVAVREAQMLGKCVAITDYATARRQLQQDVDGVIVPMDNEGCAAALAALLRDEEKRKQLEQTCLSRDYSGRGQVEKLCELME